MTWWQQFRNRKQIDQDLADEIRQHIDEVQAELISNGMPEHQARAEAKKRFGNVTGLREQSRDAWNWQWAETIWMDLRYGLRQLRRNLSFSTIAVLILAIGIGASTAVYSIVDAVLLRPLPVHDPDRLVRVANTGEGGLSSVTSRARNLQDWRRLSKNFEDLAGYYAFYDYGRYILHGTGEPERLVGVGITESFLPMLGVKPALGRSFTSEECQWRAPQTIILTDSFWRSRFAADPDIIGKTLRIDQNTSQVVGVLPASFDFATIFQPGSHIDFLTPFPVTSETDRWGNTLAVFGRLKPGVSVDVAQSELDSLNRQLEEEDPGRWGLGAAVTDLRSYLTSSYRDALVLLGAAVLLVLIVACTNLSNLLLSRAASRRKEVAVRSAIGAGRMRLVRQLLTESIVLAASGGIVGGALAFLILRIIRSLPALAIPMLQSADLDGRALLFAVGITMLCALFFGTIPALQLAVAREAVALKDSGRGLSETQSRTHLRNVLVVSEIALACVLLVGAGLLLRSFVSLLDVDLGFQPQNRYAWRVQSNHEFKSEDQRLQFYETLARNVGSITGVEAVGFTDTLPLGRNREWVARAKGVQYERGKAPNIFPRLVSHGYLAAMQIPVLRGRTFTEQDRKGTRRVVVLNQAAADALWPGEDAINREAIITDDQPWTVAGVVANVRHSSLEAPPSPEIYLPVSQMQDWSAVDLVVQSRLPLNALVLPVRDTLRQLDPQMPTDEFQELGAIVDRSLAPRKFILGLVGAFAVTALL